MAQKNQTALLTNLARIAPYVAIAATSGRKGQNQLPPVDDTFTKSSTTGREHWLPSTDYPQRTRMDVALGGDLPPEPTFSEVPLSPGDLTSILRAVAQLPKTAVRFPRLFHGTGNMVERIDPSVARAASSTGNPTGELGSFFTPRMSEAQRYVDSFHGGAGRVLGAEVTLKNPKRLSFTEFDDLNRWTDAETWQKNLQRNHEKMRALKQQLIEQGHDGIIVGGPSRGGRSPEVIVFEPDPIRRMR